MGMLTDNRFPPGLARATAGSVFFALPFLLTRELWALGFTMSRFRLFLLIAVSFFLLFEIARFSNIDKDVARVDLARHALVALAIGSAIALLGLLLLGSVGVGHSGDHLFGLFALQSVPAALGAMIARSQLSPDGARSRTPSRGFASEVVWTLVGAFLVGIYAAPTRELALLADLMTPWHTLITLAVGLLIFFSFERVLVMREPDAPRQRFWSMFVRAAVSPYAFVLAASAYVLWSFSRFDDRNAFESVSLIVALSLPGSAAASAARRLA